MAACDIDATFGNNINSYVGSQASNVQQFMPRANAAAADTLPSVIDNDDLSAADACHKEANSRKQKSQRFRARRRELKIKLYGHSFNGVRETVKNPMRQIAARNRKRQADGKFLDGPRAV